MKNILYIISFFVLLLAPLSAQNEMIVNTFSDSTQKSPAIARDNAGNFIVTWTTVLPGNRVDKTDIRMQLFDPSGGKIGGEITVNSNTAGEQEKPAIAMNGQGKAVITWASYTDTASFYDIKFARFTNGLPLTIESTANTTLTNTQSNPAAAIREDGSFVIVWDSWFQDGSDRGVYGQMFDANGNKTGSEFAVNTTTAYSQTRPRVKFTPDGKFIVIWESYKQDTDSPSGYSLYMRMFSSTGTPLTGELLVNTYIRDFQWFGDLTVFDDNSFAVVWVSWEQDGEDGGIYIQRFNSDGSKSGNERRVNKTTAQYQWLPKIHKLNGENVAVVWSSWKQDGSREGVYTIFLDENNTAYTFETRVNDYTTSYQWEPDFIPTGSDKIRAVWSSWNQYGNDYDIISREVRPNVPYGIFGVSSYSHPSGTGTGKVFVHAVDSTQFTGHQYEISFDTTASNDSLYSTIKDINTNTVKVQSFPLNKGNNNFYLTPLFDGCAVEYIPVYKLGIDESGSYFKKTSGTNLNFNVTASLTGVKKIAPVDIVMVWGSTDTLPTGQYSSPLDTALSTSGTKNILIPFTARDITQNQKCTLLVKESAATRNFKWDPGEDIIFLTPPPYQVTGFNTHAQLTGVLPGGPIIMPGIGDTNFVLTARPLTPQDKFRFTLNSSYIITSAEEAVTPGDFYLSQNYPNPFNPSTTIRFSLPFDGPAKLSVYNLLGEIVAVPVNGLMQKGNHTVRINAGSFASGIYFYTIESDGKYITRKMQLIK